MIHAVVKRAIGALFLLLYATVCAGANDNLDSLKTALKNAKADSSRVDILIAISQSLEDPEEQLYYASTAMKLATKSTYMRGLANSLFQKGEAFMDLSEFDSCRQYYTQAYEIYSSIGDSAQRIQCIVQIGQSYNWENNFEVAKLLFDSAEKVAEHYNDVVSKAKVNYSRAVLANKIGHNQLALQQALLALDRKLESNDTDRIWIVWNLLGIIYDDLGNYPEAIKCYTTALSLVSDARDRQGLIIVYNNLASFYTSVDMPDESIHYYDEALKLVGGDDHPEDVWYLYNNKAEILLESGDTIGASYNAKKAYTACLRLEDECELAYVLEVQANLMLTKHRYDSAQVFFEQVKNISDKCKNQTLLSMSLRGLGLVYSTVGQSFKAERSYLEALQVAKRAKLSKEVENIYHGLYEHYKKQGQVRNALHFFELANTSKDSLLSSTVNLEVSRVASEFHNREELQKLEYRRAAQKLQLEAELKKESSNKNVLLLVLILTILLAATLVRSYFLLQNHNQKLAQLNEEKNTLMGVVAHDLRSPLNNIKGLISLIKSESNETNLSDEQRHYLHLLEDSSVHMKEMIDRVLDINAIEEMKINLDLRKHDVGSLLKATSRNLEFMSAKKNITIHSAFELQKHYANLDKGYAIQVFDNLLSNAIKFSEPSNSVIIGLKEEKGLVVVSFEDQGPGISKEDQQKLFNKFQRLEAQPTGNEESLGLGLSIVKKFVDAMMGEISVDSEPGRGTTFKVKFATA